MGLIQFRTLILVECEFHLTFRKVVKIERKGFQLKPRISIIVDKFFRNPSKGCKLKQILYIIQIVAVVEISIALSFS